MHIGQWLPITCIKSPYFHTFLDDRAEQIIPNDGRNAAAVLANFIEKIFDVMSTADMDPIVLKKEYEELNLLIWPSKELETP